MTVWNINSDDESKEISINLKIDRKDGEWVFT